MDEGLLDALLSPYGLASAVTGPGPLPPGRLLTGCVADVGTPHPRGAAPAALSGGGRGHDAPGRARFLALAEAAERYAMAVGPAGHRTVRASARELGGDCLEPFRYPRCSARELAADDCPLTAFDPAAPVRWVAGHDLAGGGDVLLPAAMAFRYPEPEGGAERFTWPSSTGHAVHTDPAEAVLRGALEVVERDAVALLWLQRMALPPVPAAVLDARTVRLGDDCARRFVAVRLLDATTDLGVPTVCCLLTAPHHPRLRHWFAAAAERTLTEAAAKALEEAVGLTALLGAPEVAAPHTAVTSNARHLGAPQRAGAFGFLTGRAAAPRVAHTPLPPGRRALTELTARLVRAGARPVAVDLTTAELADAGLTAVRVVVPDLQPLSPHPRARFAAHPRLYRAPALLGRTVLPEEELNPWPAPYA